MNVECSESRVSRRIALKQLSLLCVCVKDLLTTTLHLQTTPKPSKMWKDYKMQQCNTLEKQPHYECLL